MNQMARCLLALMLTMFATVSLATFHTFKIDEIYSNADGTVQYVVLLESQGFDGENLLGVHSLTTTQGTTVTPFPFGTNLPSTITANKRVLIATPGFAALGIVTPDYVFSNGFVPIPAGTINYAGVDQVTYAALPTDGENALNHSGATVSNLATNFAGQSASISNTCGAAIYPFPYTDVDSVGSAFCPGIMEAYVTGVSKGTTPTTFSPNETVTRVQMTTFLQRSIDQGLTRASRRAAVNQWWNPQTPTVMQTIALGASTPNACAADGEYIWTSAGNEVVQVQGSTGATVGTWTNANAAWGLQVAAGKIYVAGNTSPNGSLYMIDPTQAPGTVTTVASNLGGLPEGIAFDGTHLWTANYNGSVSIITPQAATPYPVTTVSTGFTNPDGILYDGANIWVTDYATAKLLKLDAGGAILQTVTVGNWPAFPAFDGANIWVPNYLDNTITVVQASTGNVVATLVDDANNDIHCPNQLSFDGERMFLTNHTGDSVTVFKAADLSIITNVPMGPFSTPAGTCSDGINFWFTVTSPNSLLRF